MKQSHLSPMLRSVFVIFIALTLNFLSGSPVHAAAIVVNTTEDELTGDGDCSLREAVQSANTDIAFDACTAGSGADTIILPTGVYILTLTGGGEDANATGDLDILGELTIAGEDVFTTVLDGNATDRVFDLLEGANGNFVRLTVTNGFVDGEMGGGVRNSGTLMLDDSAVSSSVAFHGCDATVCGGGGGIENTGVLGLESSTVTNNSTVNVFECCGEAIGAAGIHSTGTLSLDHTTVSNNAGNGIISSNQATIRHSTISDNSALGCSGCGIQNSGTLSLEYSTVSGNSGGGESFSTFGAGLYNSGTATLVNSTISGNAAGVGPHGNCACGGGIYNEGTLNLNATTIAFNVAERDCSGNCLGHTSGGGLLNNRTVNIRNTLLSSNLETSTDPLNPPTISTPSDCAGTLNSQGYNLVHASSGCNFTGDPTGNVMGVDPRLGALQNNGGPTFTHSLLNGSPAIDAGNPSAPGSGSNACPGIDQRDTLRPQDGNGDRVSRCDIGALEVMSGAPQPIQVKVDIKPGTSKNNINLQSNGVIPVAILSTTTFDATTIDPLSVAFGPRGAPEAHQRAHIQDANFDNRPDMVLHFRTEATGIKSDDTRVCLVGKTRGAKPIAGCDTIQILR